VTSDGDSTTAASPAAYADVVDTQRYPIHDLTNPTTRELIADCRRQLDETGVAVLHDFLRPAAIAAMVDLALCLAPQAHKSDQSHNVWFTTPDPSDLTDVQVRSSKHGIAYDLIPADAPVRRLYESDDLTAFIAAVLDKPVLHRGADPLDAMQMTIFGEGDELGWHFDNSEFSITLMYQPAEEGGDFVYWPRLRSATHEDREAVCRVATGEDTSGLRVLDNRPGTLAFFRGQHALHRVTPITSERPRVNTVLTYGERPDMRLSDLTSQIFYGRTSPRAQSAP
jgi:hypothetical protein